MGSAAQPTPHEELDSYEVRAIVAGTRGFNDYHLFSRTMEEYHAQFAGKKVVYISGKASSGADEMIIRWCKETGRPWAEFPARWDDLDVEDVLIKVRIGFYGAERYNARAGFIRNAEMARVGTHLVTFYDGRSKGTRDMMRAMLRKVPKENVLTVLIDIEQQYERVADGWRQQKTSAERDSRVDREAASGQPQHAAV